MPSSDRRQRGALNAEELDERCGGTSEPLGHTHCQLEVGHRGRRQAAEPGGCAVELVGKRGPGEAARLTLAVERCVQ